MEGQLSMFPTLEAEQKKKRKATDKAKRKWEDGFQKWSNEKSQDGTEPTGCCGWGWMCDNCADNSYGRPCVRALNKTCRNEGITIDYENTTYEDAWYGRFGKEKDGRTDKQTGGNNDSSNAERA
jgi:hypothetical protein